MYYEVEFRYNGLGTVPGFIGTHFLYKVNTMEEADIYVQKFNIEKALLIKDQLHFYAPHHNKTDWWLVIKEYMPPDKMGRSFLSREYKSSIKNK